MNNLDCHLTMNYSNVVCEDTCNMVAGMNLPQKSGESPSMACSCNCDLTDSNCEECMSFCSDLDTQSYSDFSEESENEPTPSEAAEPFYFAATDLLTQEELDLWTETDLCPLSDNTLAQRENLKKMENEQSAFENELSNHINLLLKEFEKNYREAKKREDDLKAELKCQENANKEFQTSLTNYEMRIEKSTKRLKELGEERAEKRRKKIKFFREKILELQKVFDQLFETLQKTLSEDQKGKIKNEIAAVDSQVYALEKRMDRNFITYSDLFPKEGEDFSSQVNFEAPTANTKKRAPKKERNDTKSNQKGREQGKRQKALKQQIERELTQEEAAVETTENDEYKPRVYIEPKVIDYTTVIKDIESSETPDFSDLAPEQQEEAKNLFLQQKQEEAEAEKKLYEAIQANPNSIAEDLQKKEDEIKEREIAIKKAEEEKIIEDKRKRLKEDRKIREKLKREKERLLKSQNNRVCLNWLTTGYCRLNECDNVHGIPKFEKCPFPNCDLFDSNRNGMKIPCPLIHKNETPEECCKRLKIEITPRYLVNKDKPRCWRLCKFGKHCRDPKTKGPCCLGHCKADINVDHCSYPDTCRKVILINDGEYKNVSDEPKNICFYMHLFETVDLFVKRTCLWIKEKKTEVKAEVKTQAMPVVRQVVKPEVKTQATPAVRQVVKPEVKSQPKVWTKTPIKITAKPIVSICPKSNTMEEKVPRPVESKPFDPLKPTYADILKRGLQNLTIEAKAKDTSEQKAPTQTVLKVEVKNPRVSTPKISLPVSVPVRMTVSIPVQSDVVGQIPSVMVPPRLVLNETKEELPKKRVPCKYFSKGDHCPYGKRCNFLHVKTKPILCKFFAEGKPCLHGAKCRFIHTN